MAPRRARSRAIVARNALVGGALLLATAGALVATTSDVATAAQRRPPTPSVPAASVTAPSQRAADTLDVVLLGHGFGPGVGMGQWGAFGYAEQYHETYSWILAHYYGGTVPGQVDDPTISVAIAENDGSDVVLTSDSAFSVAGKSFKAREPVRIALTDVATHSFEIESGASCTGSSCCDTASWTKVTTTTTQPVAEPANDTPQADQADSLALCRADGVYEPIRGQIEAVDHGGTIHTVNLVPLEQYLRGVVPLEVSPAWGQFGSAGPNGKPWGFQALESQAVASRSYAMAYFEENGGWSGYADICDSDCQSYDGMVNESALSDDAIADTAGQIRDIVHTTDPATTEYSASTGGYTAGGPFPAVPDAGDGVCVRSEDFTCNPNHDWTADVGVASIDEAYPSIGAFVSLVITQQNGLGAAGGRVLELRISGSKGSVSVTGDDFAATFGLLSNWFSVDSPGTNHSGLGGYWLSSAGGSVAGFGTAGDDGSLGTAPTSPIAAMAGDGKAQGYWLCDSAGDIYALGKAVSDGSMSGKHLNAPIVGIAATPDDKGYWLVASDGGIFSFGDARFYGSTGAEHLNKPIVGMAPTPDGKGYWLVAADGGIFAFGDARFHGSTGAIHLNKPIVGMAPAPGGGGYWLVASDGGIFAFGTAHFWGSTGADDLTSPAVGMLPTPDGDGYEIATSGGPVYPFGNAPQFAAATTQQSGTAGSIVAIAGLPA